ncbi:2-aminoethylphosphonate ABC transporter permease subunit [Actinoplanes sp. TBRC 11911]|uniref:2-aminoethylphosphonate ABC transporter permease subunit n=1 Tax=Actinoplanes sp. TBRC 11911 TaxID=2729386 RepID=UPI00145E91EB|nr:2-aminoethylphosphonate ABC transporter permease subunit [Actinoplanes sp. TBRC 11911]NMO49726.1 2-aminoethylphosphonate ABC transporter permease subunit [Actinoplanes sp. TBRC 11911]
MTAAVEAVLPADAARPRTRRARLGGVSLIGPLAVLGLLFIYPLVTVVEQSFEDRLGRPAGAVAWHTVLASAEFRTGLLTTVEIAAGATVGCVVIGTFIAIVLAFVPFPGSAAVARLTTVILAFPSFFIALSFAVLYGRVGVLSSIVQSVTGHSEALGGFIHTRWAVLLAEITFYTPFVIRPVLAAAQQMQTEQLRVAASLGARPWTVVRRVLLPELLPSIVAGAGLCLMLTLNEFGIILFIGAKGVLTLPVLIYTKGIVAFDYPSAAVLACVQVALSMLLYLLGRLLVARIGGRRAGLD